ncbi:MAG: family peptidase [Flavisolibacter sp.]|nr:family peptidase [Flavisolibacter sp.]
MKNIIPAILLAAIIGSSCNSSSINIFSNKTPHEKYADKLEDNGLEKTPEGRQWLAASAAALRTPQAIQLPYRHSGLFPADNPLALGLSFTAKQGERLTFALTKNKAMNFVLYAELYKQEANGAATLLHAADTAATEFSYDVTEEGVAYILKLQPQLFRSGSYDLSIAVGPSIGFPIAGGKGSVGSFWGAVRDAGKRSHEGIDIFASKRTPAIAAADGHITGVRDGGIGGKTVWLRPADKNYTLYYAHLDEQLVQEGQSVKRGDTVGLVGNTGNAKYTPSHLHFGIYGNGGAVDPYPFVSKQKTASGIPDKKLPNHLRLLKDYKATDAVVKRNTLLVPLAYNSKGYIAVLPDGRMVQTSFALVQSVVKPLKKTKAIAQAFVFNAPAKEASTKSTIQPGASVSVLGYFNEYVFVQAGEKEGWVLESAINGY